MTTRITGSQRAARKRNIKIAQKAKKKAGGGFSNKAVSLQLGRRKSTKANRTTAKKELTAAVKYSKAKKLARGKARFNDPARYSLRKTLRKKAERVMLKKMGKWG